MEKEKIQEVIAVLQERSRNEEAFLGFYGNHIRANRLGLERYALELLKASMEADENPTHPIDTDWISYDTDYLFHYIEVNKSLSVEDHYAHGNSLKDTISKISYVLIGFIGLTILGIGCITIINWFK